MPTDQLQPGMSVGRLPTGRPLIMNPDGSMSNEFSSTQAHPDLNNNQPTNFPTMFGGRRLHPVQALRMIIESGGIDPETGQAVESFPTFARAGQEAGARSRKFDAPSGRVLEQYLQDTGQSRQAAAEMARLLQEGQI